MASEKAKTQRRVYVLPSELVERILDYQRDTGLQSEVEAVRRLLDEFLKRRDDWRAITRRFLERLKITRVLTDSARDVLIGHPQIHKLIWNDDYIEFVTNTRETVKITRTGVVDAKDRDEYAIAFGPEGDVGKPEVNDDEIPSSKVT